MININVLAVDESKPYSVPIDNGNHYIMLYCDTNWDGIYDTWQYYSFIDYDINDKVFYTYYEGEGATLWTDAVFNFYQYDYELNKWNLVYYNESVFFAYNFEDNYNKMFHSMSIYQRDDFDNVVIYNFAHPFYSEDLDIIKKPLLHYTTIESLLLIIVFIQLIYLIRSLFSIKGVY